MGGCKMSKDIPTEEEFAKAFAALARRSRGLRDLRDIVLGHFKGHSTLHDFFIIDTSENTFFAHVFYSTNQDIANAKQTGLDKDIEATVVSELSKIRNVAP